MSRFLHIVLILMTALGFCLTAQQPHHINARRLAHSPRGAASGFIEVEHPTSVQDAPPAGDVVSHRETNSGGGGGGGEDSQPRPTRFKTPAAETVLPTNTKVPVAMSTAAAAASGTSLSDPGFIALVASLGLMTLGMTLV